MKVAVIAGGKSSEREVSLKSAAGICIALKSKGHYTEQFDLDEAIIDNLTKFAPDVIYIALHGKYGEDGCIQGLLDILGIPYTGSGVLASALAMDKSMSKKIFVMSGIPTPAGICMDRSSFNQGVLENEMYGLRMPVVVKPACEGSSFGLSIVYDKEELLAAMELVFKYDQKAIIEEYVKGMEVTVGVLGNQCPRGLTPIEIVPKNKFYDYESKYTPGMSEHIMPARIDADLLVRLQELAVQAHVALGCRGLSRSDFMLDEQGNPYLLEVNTLPGMTETSLLPDAARYEGMAYADLTDEIIKMALLVE